MLVLIVDGDTSDWIAESEEEQAVDFLPADKLLSWVQDGAVPGELLQRCIALDAAYCYEPVREIGTQKDIEDFLWATGSLHDAFIAGLRREGENIRALFDGVWGCRVEIVFEGEAVCHRRRGVHYFDEWLDCSVALADGFVYLIDCDGVTPDELDEDRDWFRARRMKYRIIPE